MVDGLEHERGRLIDRGCARAGGRIGLRAGMDRERGKAWDAVGHGRSSSAGTGRSADPAAIYRSPCLAKRPGRLKAPPGADDTVRATTGDAEMRSGGRQAGALSHNGWLEIERALSLPFFERAVFCGVGSGRDRAITARHPGDRTSLLAIMHWNVRSRSGIVCEQRRKASS